jgi:hypothetical protein
MLADGAKAVGESVVMSTNLMKPLPVSGLADWAVRSVSGKVVALALAAFLEVNCTHVVDAE